MTRFKVIVLPSAERDIGEAYAWIADDRRITATVTHSTMAARQPGSVDRTFLKDLDAADGWFVREGRRYLDLTLDSGTMEFDR